jgi:hypothetical protein
LIQIGWTFTPEEDACVPIIGGDTRLYWHVTESL